MLIHVFKFIILYGFCSDILCHVCVLLCFFCVFVMQLTKILFCLCVYFVFGVGSLWRQTMTNRRWNITSMLTLLCASLLCIQSLCVLQVQAFFFLGVAFCTSENLKLSHCDEKKSWKVKACVRPPVATTQHYKIPKKEKDSPSVLCKSVVLWRPSLSCRRKRMNLIQSVFHAVSEQRVCVEPPAVNQPLLLLLKLKRTARQRRSSLSMQAPASSKITSDDGTSQETLAASVIRCEHNKV